MRRRITLLATMTALLAVLLLAVPLGWYVARSYVNDERLELQRAAATAAATVRGDSLTVAALHLSQRDIVAGVYDSSGRLLDGVAGASDRSLTRAAALGAETTGTTPAGISVAAPVTDGDTVVAVVVLSKSLATADHRSLIAWLLIAATGGGAVLIAAVGARLVARRLTRPIDHLRAGARLAGSGDFAARVAPSGVEELDELAATLNDSAQRIQTMVERERALSTEISHQLRTPLTALRLELEALQSAYPNEPGLASASSAVDRLRDTITDIIGLARDIPVSHFASIDELLRGVETRWHGIFAAAARPLRCPPPPEGPTHIAVSPAACAQILDILIDNAYAHGLGTVTVRARVLENAVSFDVSDEGPGPTREPHDIFQRRDGAQPSGIGLPFARRLAEAEHARVTLATGVPTTFSFLAPAVAPG